VGRRDRALIAVAAVFLLAAAPLGAGAGTVTGRVVWHGAPRSLPDAEVKVDRHVCGDHAASEALVVGRGGGVRWAVAYLEGAAAPPAEPTEVALANRRCRFVPHVLAARVGAEIAVINEDPVLHNLRARLPGPREVFNVVQPTQGQVSRRAIKRAGVIRVTCDAHPTMLAWIVAFEHPFFAVTDGEGRFAIAGVPPGTYRLSLWHERQGAALDPALSREVVVPADGTVTVDFTLADR
jgi:hypothetical protein